MTRSALEAKTVTTARSLAEPAHKRGRYEVRGELAHGGMGVVYRVFDIYVEREVAQKRLALREERGRARLTALCLHRDRAHVALIARDATAFERHLSAMARWFRATKNPALIQQCERFASEGLKAGLSAPWLNTLELLDPRLVRAATNEAALDQDCTALLSEAELAQASGPRPKPESS